jgi:IS1 family transposase
MATLGKVLAVFNVLAAIGFLVVAGMDYSKRQSWAYAHFRHQLAVYGLPLDKDDDTWRLPGRTISEQFGKDAAKDLFGSPDGPKTQVDEVNGTVAAFKNGVSAAADITAKRNIIAEHLLPELARAEERDEVLRELLTLKDPAGVDALVARFDAIAGRTTKGDRETRRRATADFLYNFEYSDPRHKRVQDVVGLDQYVAAAERQTSRLRDMIARDRRTIAENQAAFVAQYQQALPELTVLAGQLQALESKLTEQKDLVQKHTALRNARKTEVMTLSNELAKEKQEAAKELAALEAVQRELFAVQQDWARALARNQQLERDLRNKETEK